MPIIQHQLAFARPLAARVRGIRRPFRPSPGPSPYRLPHEAGDLLTTALTPYRNREAAFALAVFLARFWTSPSRVLETFHIDRRALAKHMALGLSEKRVRTAIRALEEVGFLDRAVASGSLYKPTELGLRKKPIRYQFGSEYAPLFIAANKRAAAARGRIKGAPSASGPRSASRPCVTSGRDFLKGPKNRNPSERSVYMGPLKSGIPPKASELNPNLKAALDRLKEAIGLAGSSGGEGSGR